jgi:hypothetical protein
MQETLEACKKSLNINLLLLSASWSSWWPLVVGEYGANIMHKPVQFANDRSIVGMESKEECETGAMAVILHSFPQACYM